MNVWVVMGMYNYDDCNVNGILKICSTEENAQKFKDEYDSNPHIPLVKELYRKWIYGGEEIYDDENSEDPKVIGYVEKITNEEFLIYKSFGLKKQNEYRHFESSYIDIWEVD